MYIKVPAAKVMMINAANPIILAFKSFTFSPIICLLFEMCRIIAIKTGAVNPYKTAV